eukprot:TRINITY_DN3278_c0_g1_i2.p1 TRINITY_DN3278_c0_g1~~TRINITY_DN3278_c0_g1_i2.p1  ORF type:complete len:762 (+),score=144.33 TRINITY_DN3278_c0_g1_i2:60-2345(+)
MDGNLFIRPSTADSSAVPNAFEGGWSDSRESSRPQTRSHRSSRGEIPYVPQDLRGLPHVRNSSHLRGLVNSTSFPDVKHTKYKSAAGYSSLDLGQHQISGKYKSPTLLYEAAIHDIKTSCAASPDRIRIEKVFELFENVIANAGMLSPILADLGTEFSAAIYSAEYMTSTDVHPFYKPAPYFDQVKVMEDEKRRWHEEKQKEIARIKDSFDERAKQSKKEYDSAVDALNKRMQEQQVELDKYIREEEYLQVTISGLQKMVRQLSQENDDINRAKRLLEDSEDQDRRRQIAKLDYDLTIMKDKLDKTQEELINSLSEVEQCKAKIRDMVPTPLYEEERAKVFSLHAEIDRMKTAREELYQKMQEMENRVRESVLAEKALEERALTPRPQYSPRLIDWIDTIKSSQGAAKESYKSSEIYQFQRTLVYNLCDRYNANPLDFIPKSLERGMLRHLIDDDTPVHSARLDEAGTASNVLKMDMYIVCGGPFPRIPKYFQHVGRHKNRNLGPQQVENLVKDILQQKDNLERKSSFFVPLGEYFYSFLKKKYPSQSQTSDWAYNIYYGCFRNFGNINCKVFYKMLIGELPDGFHTDQMKMIETLFSQCQNVDRQRTGKIKKNALMRIISKMFPTRSDEDMDSLRIIINQQQPGPSVDYQLILRDEALSFANNFSKMLREQHLYESEEYAVNLEVAIREAAQSETPFTSVVFLDVVRKLDPRKTEHQILEMFSYATSCSVSDFQYVAHVNITLEPFLQRLRKENWYRYGK